MFSLIFALAILLVLFVLYPKLVLMLMLRLVQQVPRFVAEVLGLFWDALGLFLAWI